MENVLTIRIDEVKKIYLKYAEDWKAGDRHESPDIWNFIVDFVDNRNYIRKKEKSFNTEIQKWDFSYTTKF